MISTGELLKRLHALGIRFKLDGDELKLKVPKGVMTAELKDELTAAKPDIIAFLRKTSASSETVEKTPRASRDGKLPLSSPQQRLWFIDRLEDTGHTYHIPTAVKLQGDLNVRALDRVFDEIVARHEVLRLTFAEDNGVPYLALDHAPWAGMDRIDLNSVPANERTAHALQLSNAEARRPFDLSKGPLFRARLLQISDQEHHLLITMHHIISDGWSVGVLIRELTALYSAFIKNVPSPLPPLEIQFVDYCVWLEQGMGRQHLERQRDYWRRQLADAPTLHDLPTDQPRPKTQTFEGAVHHFDVDAQTTAALKQLAQQAGASLFMCLETVFALLLKHYTHDQETFVLGTPLANRTRKEVEPLIGLFLNTLALRNDLSGDPAFLKLLERNRAMILDAFANQDLPFEQVIDTLNLERSLSHPPLFQILFVLQNAPMAPLALPNLKLSLIETTQEVAKFDLTLVMTEADDRLLGGFEYNTDLFDTATIARMTGHFKTLLGEVVREPNRKISQYNLITEDERHLMLHSWNQTNHEYASESCVHELFEDQVRKKPERTAITVSGRDGLNSFTYAELNAHANTLAHRLIEAGVRPEHLVGVAVSRSPEMVIALLGILKAGAAYVPLDPGFPAERIAYMLDDSGLAVLVSNVDVAENLPDNQAQIILVDTHNPSSDGQSNPGLRLSSQVGAYVIYTSGSTGKPKGVLLQHRNVVNILTSVAAKPGITANDRMLALSTISFDIAVVEMFLPLLNGASLVLADKKTITDPIEINQLMLSADATIMQATPATWRMMFDSGWRGKADLKVFCGGEALPPGLAHKMRQNCADVWNMYGPTETTIYSVIFPIDESPGQRYIPIGRPIANTSLYVVNRQTRLLPIGAPGELLIGGYGLARGYINRSRHTAERFIPDPFSNRLGERLYRTGDLVRYLPDGNMVFINRIDSQIKLRGYRIELGEIEAALTQIDSIKQAVAILYEPASGSKELVAWVRGDFDGDASPEGRLLSASESSPLRKALRKRLPEYMIPSHFVVIGAFPTTPSGKLDRQKLPHLSAIKRERDAEYVAPRNGTEQVLASIWGEVLGMEHIGVHANFFDLGGHSLVATRVTARIRTELKIELPLRTLFSHPTIESLSGVVTQCLQDGKARTRHLPPITRSSSDQPPPLSFSQERIWFLDQLDEQGVAYSMPFVFRVQGQMDTGCFVKALETLSQYHETLRTNFIMMDGVPRQLIHPSLTPEFRVVSKEDGEGQDPHQLIKHEIARPFDLANDCLLRVIVIEESEEERLLLWNMHHIISDGWTIGILIRELLTLYEAFARGHAAPHGAPELQFSDFAVWQKQYFDALVFEEQSRYWKTRLLDAPGFLDLPTDFPRPARQTFNGDLVQIDFEFELFDALQKLSRQTGSTLFMVLQAGLAAVLGRYSGQQDLCIGTPVANRTYEETEAMVGLFMNTLVLRNDLGGDPTFLGFLERTRIGALEAFANQDLPFAKVVELANTDRSLDVSPLFQVMIILQNATSVDRELSGLNITPLNQKTGTSKFDMTFAFQEDKGVLNCTVEYNTDLFKSETATRMINHLQRFLKTVCASPELKLSQYRILDDAELEKQLNTWNQTGQDYASDTCLHQLFEDQVRKGPERTALIVPVRDGLRSYTYAEVNAHANVLADRLIKAGVKPDHLVGVAVERSPEMVIALLGILKAGGAYVPLDPEFPTERISYMQEHSGLEVLVSMAGVAENLPKTDAQLMLVDVQDVPLDDRPNPCLKLSSLSGAYVIYTSGSTGKPKGVLLQHRSVVNLLTTLVDSPGITASDRMLAITTISFDIAVVEMFLPLLYGASMVLADKSFADPIEIDDLMQRADVTIMQATPATWRMMIDAGWCGKADLKIFCGGEALTLDLARRLRQKSMDFWNMYGPTETTIYSVIFQVDDQGPGAGNVPIGRPIGNTSAYVVDRHMQLLPVGAPGELLIGGNGLARGYLSRSGHTAERFIPDPFSAQGVGGRVYRTGDLVRYLPDGNIVFLNRIDAQVKLRGYRIELGEIESVLNHLDSVYQAVTLIHEPIAGSKELVAWLRGEFGDASSPNGRMLNADEARPLRDALSQSLPNYMIPSHFVAIDVFPKTPSGKIDRKQLQSQIDLNKERDTEFVAPRNKTEQILTSIWCDVLALEQIGVYANFFDLGGHSLLANRVVARIRTELEIELPLRTLFNHPTVEALSRAVTQCLLEGKTQARQLPPITRSRDQSPPLSFSQERIWFLDQLEDQGVAYSMPFVFRIQGLMDMESFAKALETLSEYHETLRTNFLAVDGVPRQLIHSSRTPEFQVVVIDDMVGQDPHQLIKREIARPFDLARDCLLRVVVVEESETERLLLWNMHHIISDGWTIGILIRELLTLYEAFARGDVAPHGAPELQYADYAAWQKQYFDTFVFEEQSRYWKTCLQDAPTVLDLPTDFPRPARQTFHGDLVQVDFDAELLDTLQKLSRQTGSTLFMVLQAGLAVVLGSYSGQKDLCIGTPVANRSYEETEAMIGLFMNTLVLRNDLGGDPTFLEFLERTRIGALEAFANQDLPFAKVVELVKTDRSLDVSPLFQVMIILQNATSVNQGVSGLTFTPVNQNMGAAKFDLTFAFQEVQDVLSCTVEYNTDLFKSETVARIINHLQRFLKTVCASPESRISQFRILDDHELEQQLFIWNQTGQDYASDSCLHHLFEDQVRRGPERIALTVPDQGGLRSFTYAEINAHANILADRLVMAGVKPEHLVGVAVERSPEMVIALLGILKAGGAYVPIDPEFPTERIAFMLEHSELGVLVSMAGIVENLPKIDAQIMLVNAQEAPPEDLPNHDIKILSQSGAYVIYTSGSTGKPKGVHIQHCNVANFLTTMAARPGITADDRLLAVTTISFDIAGLELFLPLLNGATLILVDKKTLADPFEIERLMQDADATIMQATPATWRMLIDAGWRGKADLKILCGGEAFPLDLARALRRNSADVWNMYGPTETTIWSTILQVNDHGPGTHYVSIGRPIGNTTVYVVDPHMQLLPIGAPGELLIGGSGLARGYLHRSGHTAERFIPDPFSTLGGGRLYRTGDLVRFLPEGNLVFLNRIDAQIKLRGYRIELGEIETALIHHESVVQAVALIREPAAGSKELIAWVRGDFEDVSSPEGRLLNADEARPLRDALRQSLPDYMIPSHLVAIDTFPTTPNRKIDRKTLAAFSINLHQTAKTHIEPSTVTEQKIVHLWAEILNNSSVGATDNFFEVGGNSLLLVKLRTRMQETFGRDISMVDLFQYPSIQAMAAHLDGAEASLSRPGRRRAPSGNDTQIAVIGMSGRFPGANGVDAYWENLHKGVESIKFFSDEELRAAGVDEASMNNPNFVNACGVLDGIANFDASFFGYSANEAMTLDPQHRVYMECVWEALEHAGYNPYAYEGDIGVFSGASINTYVINNLLHNTHLMATEGAYRLVIANDKDFLTTRIAYKLNLRGPAMSIQTACSTSLVAIDSAREALIAGKCDIAVAGGVAIRIPQDRGYVYQEGMISSPDGHCSAFDADANGTVNGNGAGVVVLKRLDAALEDGDHILAVIKGGAVNNDGSDKVSYTAPSVSGQVSVIQQALDNAQVTPDSISLIEAHGTGTLLGDPIEIASLTQAWRAYTDRSRYCAIGSVKSNIGHLDAAAGVAGFIKAVQALRHKTLPPTLNVTTPNPKCQFDQSPFFVNTQTRSWESEGPRRAGVSSFGIGGSNAHLILEEAPQQESDTGRPHVLLPLSAKTEQALTQAQEDLAEFLKKNPELNMADVSYTLQLGRAAFENRCFVTASGREDAIAALEDPKRLSRAWVEKAKPTVVFMFSGQGSQYAGMGAALYQQEPVFRREVDRCAVLLEPLMGKDVRVWIVADASQSEQADQELRQTRFTQPALFTLEYALAELWRSWGLVPEAMIGHSIGEYVAATQAGVFELEDALRVVCERGRLMDDLPRGSMLSVPLSEAEIEALLPQDLAIATVNAADRCVISGPVEAIESFKATLAEKGVTAVLLHTSHAYHSPMMDPILAPFEAMLAGITLAPPKTAWVSNLTGTWITPEQAVDPAYYAQHLRGTVRFHAGLDLLLDQPRVFLEVGPGHALHHFVTRHEKGKGRTIPSLPTARERGADLRAALEALGQLHLKGVSLDWNAFNANERRLRIPLPTYPWRHQSYWVEPVATDQSATIETTPSTLTRAANPEQWLYRSNWRSVEAAPEKDWPQRLKLVLSHESEPAVEITAALRQHPGAIVEVRPGETFQHLGDGIYTVNPSEVEHFINVLRELAPRVEGAIEVIHLWSLTPDDPDDTALYENASDAITHLTRAMRNMEPLPPIAFHLVSNGLLDTGMETRLHPHKAVVLGPLAQISQELPGVSWRCLDMAVPSSLPKRKRTLACLQNILATPPCEDYIALRGAVCLTREPAPFTSNGQGIVLKQNGVYLIHGAATTLGRDLVRHLTQAFQARLLFTLSDEQDEAVDDLTQSGQLIFLADESQALKEIQTAIYKSGGLDGAIFIDTANEPLSQLQRETRLMELIMKESPGFMVRCSEKPMSEGAEPADAAALRAALDLALLTWFEDIEPEIAVIHMPACDDSSFDGTLETEVMTAEERGVAFEAALASGEREVLVSPYDQTALRAHIRALRTAARDESQSGATRLHQRPELRTQYEAPRNELEERLVQIWGRHLGVDGVGVYDSFMDLGGDSLMAAQVLARINHELQIEIAPGSLFEEPTIAGLAGMILSIRNAQPGAEAGEMDSGEIDEITSDEIDWESGELEEGEIDEEMEIISGEI